jgi:hypothetical protein
MPLSTCRSRRRIAALLLGLLSCTAGPASRAHSAKPGKEDEPLPLLGTTWDFADGDLSAWRHKDNARIAVAEEEGNPALRLSSDFGSYRFTWTTRHFPPHTADGVVHVNFRVRGDSSGHRLEVQLGAPEPGGGGSLYYGNEDQALTLDFDGWRDVSLDLDAFDTPAGGLRERDLAGLVFLEFIIFAPDGDEPPAPLDILIDDVRFTGYTPDEEAERRRQEKRREEITAEVTASLDEVDQKLAELEAELAKRAEQRAFVDVARVYLSALDWCADDVRRLLEAEEFSLVEQAPALVADLKKRLDEPDCVARHVLDAPPAEEDPLGYDGNPYFQSVVDGVRPWITRERTWEKGRRGYVSIPNAWTFRSLGDQVYAQVWAMTRAGSPVRHDPQLAAAALSIFDTVAHQHTEGDFNIDRTASHGRDPNINRFCLAPTLDAWCLLLATYPDLLPPAKRADVERGLRVLALYQVTDYGLARLERKPHEEHPVYPNMDVHFILIMELAHRLWGDEIFARERDARLDMLLASVYPMGAWPYINTQNECFVYHKLNVLYMARFWQLTGGLSQFSRSENGTVPLRPAQRAAVLAMLRKTIPFYPDNVEPAGVPEYYTDACWKHYWAGATPEGPDTIAGLFDDPLNKRVAEICADVQGYDDGQYAAIAAEFFKPIASKPLRDGYVMFDENVQGPRGRYGTWSFGANGRNYGVGYQGKDTFVGCMVTDPEARPMPLDAALQVVTTEVRLNHTDNHWRGGRCHSALEKLTTAVGPDFGSLAVRYTVSKPNWHHERDELLPWTGTQQWYLSERRLVGLVALEATADETRAAVHGRIRLGMKREIERLTDEDWRYGRLRIKLHAHNYAAVTSQPSETFFLDKPDRYRSTEITLKDPLSVAAGEKGEVTFPKGTRYWFLVEVFREGVDPAEEVVRIEEGPIVSFRFREPGRNVAVLHNPTDARADAPLPLAVDTPAAMTIYRAAGAQTKPIPADGPTVSLKPHEHVVVVSRNEPQ